MKSILLIFILTLTGCAVPISEIREAIRQDGMRANSLGVEPSANPYQGRNYGYSVLWLEGWMDSESKKNPELSE